MTAEPECDGDYGFCVKCGRPHIFAGTTPRVERMNGKALIIARRSDGLTYREFQATAEGLQAALDYASPDATPGSHE